MSFEPITVPIEDALAGDYQYLIYNVDHKQYLFVRGDKVGKEHKVLTHDPKFYGEQRNLFKLVGTSDNFTLYNDFYKVYVRMSNKEDRENRKLVLADVGEPTGSTLRTEIINLDRLQYKFCFGTYTITSTDVKNCGGDPTDRSVRAHLGPVQPGDAWQILERPQCCQ